MRKLGSADNSPQVASLVAAVTSLAAPLTLLAASTVYFAGSVYEDELLGYFGIRGDAITSSVQETLANGYYVILAALWLPFLLASVTFLIIHYSVILPARFSGVKFNIHRRVSSSIRLFRVFYLILVATSIGWYAGYVCAAKEYAILHQNLNRSCTKCFLYNTTRGRVVGLPIGQDDKSFIVATRTGAAILPAGAVKAVRPINRQSPLPNWMLNTPWDGLD